MLYSPLTGNGPVAKARVEHVRGPLCWALIAAFATVGVACGPARGTTPVEAPRPTPAVTEPADHEADVTEELPSLPSARAAMALDRCATLMAARPGAPRSEGAADAAAWAPAVLRLGSDGLFLGDERLVELDAPILRLERGGADHAKVRAAFGELARRTPDGPDAGCGPGGRSHPVVLIVARGDLPVGPVMALLHLLDLHAMIREVAFAADGAPSLARADAPHGGTGAAIVDLREDEVQLITRQTQLSGPVAGARDVRAAVSAVEPSRFEWLHVDAAPSRTFADLVAAIDEAHARGMPCVRVAPGERYADAATWREVGETVARYLEHPRPSPGWHDAPSWAAVPAALGGEVQGVHLVPTADLLTGRCPGSARLEVGW